jgi:hypothetical protein
MKRNVKLDDDVEDLIAPLIRRKGDLSKIVNNAIRTVDSVGDIETLCAPAKCLHVKGEYIGRLQDVEPYWRCKKCGLCCVSADFKEKGKDE